MNPIEANAVLAQASQFDGRKPDAEAAISWATALHGLRVEDCIEAVKAHYATETAWIMPANVRALANAQKLDRIERGKPFLVPPDFGDLPDHELDRLENQWFRDAYRRLADGEPPTSIGPMRAVGGMGPETRAELDAGIAEATRKPDAEPEEDETA